MENMTKTNNEKLNMEHEDRILFGNKETIRMFVQAKYEKSFLATSLNLYPINCNPDTPPICALYTTNGRKYKLTSNAGSTRYLEGRGGQKMSLTNKRSKGYHQYYTINIQDDDIFLVEVCREYENHDSLFPEASYQLISMRPKNDSLTDQIEYMLEYCRIRKVFKMQNVYIADGIQAWGNSITPNGFGDAGKTFGHVNPGYNRMMRNTAFRYDYTGIIKYSNAYHCFDLFVGQAIDTDEKLFEYLSTYVVPQRDKDVWGITKDDITDHWLDFPPTSFPDVRCTLNWKGEWRRW